MQKILVVEDNQVNRDLLARRLLKKGFEVILALNGQEGVQKAFETLPDLILMDLSLPLIDGWEATRQIKSNEKTKLIPVIAVTAHAMQGDREKALSAGCDEYETKPIDFIRLLEKMEKLMSLGSQ
ncbi:MAG: response regulator [Elusimicrobiota bacterium]